MARERSYYDGDRRHGNYRRGQGMGPRIGRRDRRKRTDEERRRRFSAFDWAMFVLSCLVVVGAVLSWAARWIDPHAYGFMSAAGLVMPVLFVGNFLILLYWAIRWRWGVWIPLAVFLAGVWGVSLFFRPEFTLSHGDNSRDRSLVSVVSYNVRGMMRPVEGWPGRVRSSMADVVEAVDSLRPDILCIQEFQSTADNPRSRFDEVLPLYNYKRVRYNITGGSPHLGWGNAIYSKFPITNSGHIDFEGTSNSILWADVAVQRDTMRVFCAHLQTTAIKAEDERYIVGMDFVGDSTRTSQVRRMMGRLTDNYMIRAVQADTLAIRIASSPHPVVVCGDFNDTPVSYAYRKVSHRLKDSFREAGRGYGHTYRGFFDMLRIDYVLHSRDFECVEYSSPSFDASDHNPVAVKLRIN